MDYNTERYITKLENENQELQKKVIELEKKFEKINGPLTPVPPNKFLTQSELARRSLTNDFEKIMSDNTDVPYVPQKTREQKEDDAILEEIKKNKYRVPIF